VEPDVSSSASTVLDFQTSSLREINQTLHDETTGSFTIVNPRGAHAVAAGIDSDIQVEIDGPVGYYCAGMHQRGSVVVKGNASTGLAENMMSGTVRITGNATMSAGATACGGLLVIEGNAGSRCGISMKGADIVVGGTVGHMSAFMAQSGNLVVLGDTDSDLGDSIYEARLFIRGDVASLGADCIEKEMREEHLVLLTELLSKAGMAAEPRDFKRFGSGRKLYNFHVDDIDAEVARRTEA